jgi:hypothetical protein
MLALALSFAMLAQSGESSITRPIGPLERYEPRLHEVRFAVQVNTAMQTDPFMRRCYDLADAPIVMPLILQGAYSSVDPATVRGRLFLGGDGEADLASIMRIDDGKPFGTHQAVIPIAKFTGQSLRWEIEFTVQTWSSRLHDERIAEAAPWPQQWPPEALDGLKPQFLIESADPIFKQAVDEVSQGQLRMVPPYLAAKDLVRHCINEIRLTGSATNRTFVGALQGMEMVGAIRAASEGSGGPHDLVCVCVAVLRAAGIPARPVVGLEKNDRDVADFVSWAEFYLPDAGWVPFDPAAMKRKGVRRQDVRTVWPEFGTLEDLNRRIPLAYGFIPTGALVVPENPAVWGWDPRPGGDLSSDQAIMVTIISRGKGVDDPPASD